MRELDHMVVNAKVDQTTLTHLIEQNELFIIKCAATTTHRYLSKSDDEYSIALLAFHEAVKSYELNKGSFLSFAELVIRRRIIDYCRKQQKLNSEICVNPALFETDPEKESEDLSLHLAVAKKVSVANDGSLKLEIETANEVFSHYGFTFFDLTRCSPQAKKTKLSCAKSIAYILSNPLMISEIHSSKQLPIQLIEKNTKVPRKSLERHRKYIIAAVVILSGEYPKLADYLRFVREEMDK